MDLKMIYENLGLETNLKKEIWEFNIRLQSLFRESDEKLSTGEKYDSTILKGVLFKAAILPSSATERLVQLIKLGDDESILQKNLFILQIVIETVCEVYRPALKEFNEIKTDQERSSWVIKAMGLIPFHLFFISKVEELFDYVVLDIGYAYKNGVIVKTGAKELDEKLILENLEWLKKYPDSRERFSNSLKFYFTKHYADAITNAYSALEGIVKEFLGTDGRLDKDETRGGLINKLGLDSHWGHILFNYCKAAHEFSSRHGKRDKEPGETIEPELAEFFIYQTGTFLRLISQKMS